MSPSPSPPARAPRGADHAPGPAAPAPGSSAAATPTRAGSAPRCSRSSASAAAVLLAPDPQRLLEHVLRGRRQGRQRELEGVVLRRPRPGQLHHRRQAAAVAVAHRASPPASSASRASASCCPQALCTVAAVGAALRHRPARCSARRRASIAAAALALTPVTVAIGARQQPRRAARPAARRLRLVRACGRSSRAAPAPGLVRRARRAGLHDEDARRAGWSSRRSPPPTCSPDRRGWPSGSASSLIAGAAMVARQRRLAGRGHAVAGLKALHRRQHERLDLEPDLRLRRLRAA